MEGECRWRNSTMLPRGVFFAILASFMFTCGQASYALSESGSLASVDQLDVFDETLKIKPITSTLAHNRFEFSIQASLSEAFLTDMFDLFPKSIGKLLNAHPSLKGFEVAMTQGRWKDEWGLPAREFRPPGALLVAATESTADEEVEEAWKFLLSALSGSLCASFEEMDSNHNALAWIVPLDVPWTEGDLRMRFATLPYEAVCTENLTPWFKLLPCGHHQGLAALIKAIAVAESPLVSLGLNVAVDRTTGKVVLQTSLDVILPISADNPGFRAFFGGAASSTPKACLAARSSKVLLLPLQPDTRKSDGLIKFADGQALTFNSSEFAVKQGVQSLLGTTAPPFRATTFSQGLSVMRDILSREGWSERTHGRYLLRFTNHDSVGKRILFMDQLPFFISPMWHTLQATFEDVSTGAKETFQGVVAMQRISAQFVPPSRSHDPTQFFLTVDVPPGAIVNVFLDVQKNFVQLREFSYACEKGFDVSSAAWMEIDLPQLGNPSRIDDFVKSLAGVSPGDAIDSASRWRLRFTQGLLVLVPMPDFSMPFNVIALSSTALTFFFGSIFRMTAAGHLPHWALKTTAPPPKAWKGHAKRLGMLGLFGCFVWISQKSPAQIEGWRPDIEQYVPFPDAVDQIVDFLKSVRETGTKFGL